MSIFDDREQVLKCLADDLVNAVEDDFFIPQMLKHRKSADFVQERIAELFIDLYETQADEYDQHVQNLIQQTSRDIESLQNEPNGISGEAKTRQDIASLGVSQQQQNVAKLTVKKTDLEEKVKTQMKFTHSQLQELDAELTRTKQTCSDVTSIVHKLDMLLQAGKSHIAEFRKHEQLIIRKARRSVIEEINDCFQTHRKTRLETLHEESLRKEIKELKRHNRNLQKAILSVIRGFGQQNTDVDPSAMVESAVSAVRKESDISTLAEELQATDSEPFRSLLSSAH